ncbi:tetratricopeptide repeat protein [Alphaproteobacteria bacterium]|nr:tetratricopeptide repeat protein [Alphaproteobacteria bacterium]
MQNIKDQLNTVVKLFNSGEKQKAFEKINLLITGNNKNINCLLLHAKICINLNEINKANSSLEKILKLDLDNYEALKLIYINYLKNHNINLAKKYIDKLLTIQENNYEFLRDKAYIEYLNNDYLVSEKYINEALNQNSEEVFGLNILGLLYVKKDQILNAINVFKKAILINPQYPDSYNNLGKCYIDLEKLSLAYLNFKKSYKINPNSELPLINIANILSLKDKNKLAIKFYEKAKKINPNNQQIDENIIVCNVRLKNFEWVEKKVLDLQNEDKTNHELILSYSYLLLGKKKFVKGFSYFDARLETNEFQKKNKYHYNIIKTLNTNSEFGIKKNILIVREQGVGDEILFSSMYNNLIKNNFSKVKIECDKRLLEIFNRSFNKNIFYPFGHYSSSNKSLQDFDNILYAGSLTRYFRNKESDFNIEPYIKTSDKLDKKFNSILKQFNEKKRIGISWKSVFNIFGSLKSLELNNFSKLYSQDRIFINLQYGNVIEEINNFRESGRNIFSFDNVDLFDDFDSLISILKNLDVFVTVSNSTAHFAGALGVPTILICPKKSSTYYYWNYEDGKTPWYNNMSIIKFKDSLDCTMRLVDDLINKI